MKAVHKKIHAVMSEQLNAEKDGTNSHMKYKYTSFEEVLGTIRPALIKHGLTVTFSEKEVKVLSDRLMQATFTFTITDIESGEQVHSDITGLGNDSINGDKNLNKAVVSAMKYFFTKTFAITTGEDADAEADDKIYKEETKTKPSSKPVEAPKSTPVNQKTGELGNNKTVLPPTADKPKEQINPKVTGPSFSTKPKPDSKKPAFEFGSKKLDPNEIPEVVNDDPNF